MKVKAFLGVCLTLICCGFANLSAAAEKVTATVEQPNRFGMIKVLLGKDLEAVNLEVRGGYKIFDPKTGVKLSRASRAKQNLLRPTLDGIVWGEAFAGYYQIALIPNEPNDYVLINGIQYAGDLYVYQVGNTLNLVNVVPIERYVQSVLNPKVDRDLHPEVLAALAIIERTQAYYLAQKNENALWHVDAQKINYQGLGVCARSNGIDRAVEQTHHLVMKSKSYGIQDGYFNATYTEHCAGKTVPFHLIYRTEGHAYKKPVESPLALANRKDSHWMYQMDVNEFADKLGLEEVTKVEALIDQASGKVYGMHLQSKNENVDLDFIKLQSLLGKEKIKSTDFKVQRKDNTIIFDGFGRGLGVGACLYSAQEMAQRGHSASEILAAFFPNTRISFVEGR